MGLKAKFFRQFEKPSGGIGRLVGWMMSVSNKEMINWMIDKMELWANDKVLEIGYGSGDAIHAIAAKLTTGFIEGIDHSELMYRRALKKNSQYVSNNKARLHVGDVWSVRDNSNYDIICGSNVHFFWENPVDELVKIYSLLKPNGRIVLTFQPRWVKSSEEVAILASILHEQLEMAGFQNIELDFKVMKPVTGVYISGWKINYK